MKRIQFQKNGDSLVGLLPDGRVEFLKIEAESVISKINKDEHTFCSKEFDTLIEYSPEIEVDGFHLKAPAIAFIELTNRCNLLCKHCYAFSGPALKRPAELSTKEILSLLDQFDEMGVLQVFLSGGEVFTHPDATEIISHARSKRFTTQIFTNGLLIREEHLKTIPSGTSFFISFDTAKPERTVRGKMSFPILKQKFELLKSYGHVVRTAISVHNQNLDEVEEIFDWCIENDYPRPQWLETHPIGRALMHPHIMLSEERAEEAFQIFKKCMNKYIVDQKKVGDTKTIDTIKFCQRLEEATQMEKCGRSMAYVNSVGDVFPCSNCMSNSQYRAGSLRQSSFEDIWKSGFSEFRKITFEKYKSCQSCPVLKSGVNCQFRCPPLSTNLHKDPFKCGATNYLKNFMLMTNNYWQTLKKENVELGLYGN